MATIAFGIDLGTTNSCIAKWQGGAVKVFQNNDQMNVTPSVIHILKNGRVLVGRRAASAIQTDPENVATEFKRWMGQKDRKRFAAANREMSAEELSAEILKALREDVKRQIGESVDAAVITVPAAFGALQCDATARAANLAGLVESPLLQEPIAAAIGYGAQAQQSNQRWLVFDLGGGTLDIAIVSTRDGRLHVLEHRGDNLLGGKDIDRLIVEKLFMPVLEGSYNLGNVSDAERAALFGRLKLKAEEAKIDLSTSAGVTISLFDIGQDCRGTPMECDIPVTRDRLNSLMEPLFARCCTLAQEALAGARVDRPDQVLLVGGPTQTPLLREMLAARFKAQLDLSIDPMTVVGQGAAVFASTMEKKDTSRGQLSSGSHLSIKLAYDPVSSELHPLVGGRLLNAPEKTQVRIDAEGGFWTSGWLDLTDGVFETNVVLKERDTTTFWLYARDAQGELLNLDILDFTVRHGLVPTSPPLPHTLCIEIIDPSGRPILDPIFAKGTPLPTQRRVRYRTGHALVPGNSKTDIAIKLWEGDFLQDPEANEWVGNALLSNEGIRRTLPEASEVEIAISIDSSRRIKIDAFVPHLNESFSSTVFAAQRDELDFKKLSMKIETDVSNFEGRLTEIDQRIGSDDSSLKSEIDVLRNSVSELSRLLDRSKNSSDPDEARRVVEKSKNVRGSLAHLEQKAAGRGDVQKIARLQQEIEAAEEVVSTFGSSLEKQQLSMLRRELERAATKKDDSVAKRAAEEIEGLKWRVLGKQGWFWRDLFDAIREDPGDLSSLPEGQELFRKGNDCISNGDTDGLREVVIGLWKLQPKSASDLAQERAIKAGLRKF